MGASLQSRTRWRRYWRYPAVAVVVAGLLVAGLGAWIVMPYVSSGSRAAALRTLGGEVDNAVEIFDPSRVHSVSVDMTERDYGRMIEDYKEDGVKAFYPGTVTIDGVHLERVGIRLKGNSTLFGLFLGFDLRQMMRRAAPDGFRMGRPLPGEPPPAPEPAPAAPPGPPPSFEFEPAPPPPKEDLPYLFQFDEFVPGQTYQGLRQLAIREEGPTADVSLTPEIVTSDVLLATGQATTRQAYAGLSFNGSDPRLVLVSEAPDDEMARRSFPSSAGVLIKAQTGAPFRYLGSDQTDYADWFEVDSGVRRYDLAPLIDFIRWVDRSSDAEFEAGLADRLDVESFAAYLAVHNVLVNADSLGGIGNNYYFFYDLGSRRFTLVSWDVNGSLGRITLGADPLNYDPYYGDPVRMGARREGAEGPGAPPGRDGQPQRAEEMPSFPGASRMRELIPEGAEFGENLLRRRFLASPRFKALYQATYRVLHRRILVDGLARERLQHHATVVRDALHDRPSLVDRKQFEALVASNLEFLDQRRDALAARDPVKR